ncbi:hypothetical protein SeMB42_g02814 [Synchytrium endobioticum]|uniref:Bromo domain-containing protein n=1 Tax=Synchytrium endobioticum TaxID=286115 RepID=A0A507DG90_9FUNG|nr:hypothetical protein SeMB42_g02814 [Synchytrium endobioticum]TPX50556.1 hypothetical protein SeLEV6574_g00845 [Synchytrium endobioticum]
MQDIAIDARNGWTTTECLILAQLVHQTGGPDWPSISRQMQTHSCISQPAACFTPQLCETQYTALSAPHSTDAALAPTAVLARALCTARIHELRAELEQDDIAFRQLVQDVIDIRDGRLDEQLRREYDVALSTAKPPRPATPRQVEAKLVVVGDEPGRADTPLSRADDGTEVLTDGYVSGVESVDGSQPRPRKGSLARDDDRKRNFRKICMPVWDKIADHRYGNVFKNMRDEQIIGYHDVVKRPMNLVTIKQRIRDGDISSPDEFHRDLLLMLTNVIMFHNESADIYEMALVFKKFIDAELSQLRTTYQRARQ